MDWAPAVSTALGALIGVSATLLADRAHWKRDTTERGQDATRALFIGFLTAMSHARTQIWTASISDDDANQRARTARDALQDHDVFTKLNELVLCASPHTADLALEAGRRLVDYRDAIVAATRDDTDPEPSRSAYLVARGALITVMREELGS
ncbi:hypothetical protein OG453_37775 [Streptomyces sp. NBC_01381]|uniref:hypothetical protein n=1 Tax=Streptomyces sp. NBC_01381 TaxID=2903845 RepID=UPI0022546BB3|nr:hypothetical protein [Streptomyces sp. NBC_01381]MCX4672349.1 hypothetical protein [Streptomyces sp. NBC_01381]